MDFNELISDFATRHDVEGLAAEDGAAVGTGSFLQV